ncbi:hypothetical protein WA026_011997 [Henosepilachna vigintioctopunctata]|uniref:C2H2-type domain-containing protein n=1 Tax=Henosepilachna vigintioctopunctata TaxID=420089 RepID=A0AAW1V4N2_9CUCU
MWDIFRKLCYKNQGLINGGEIKDVHTCIDVKEEPLSMDESMSEAETDVSEPIEEVQTLTSNKTDGINISADFRVDQNLSFRNVSASFGVSYELQNEPPVQKLSEEEQRKTFVCKLCPKKFNSQQSVNAHIGWHKRIKKTKNTKKPKKTPAKPEKAEFVCSVCYFVLPNDTALKVHVLEKHGNTADLTPRCETCNQDFATMSEYENHKKSHEIVEFQKKLVTYPCQYCSASFNKDENLQSHIRSSHTEKFRKYRCGYCGKAFDKPSSLTNHVKVHEKQKAVVGTPKPPFVCGICNMGFKIPKQLRTHTKTAHPFKK